MKSRMIRGVTFDEFYCIKFTLQKMSNISATGGKLLSTSFCNVNIICENCDILSGSFSISCLSTIQSIGYQLSEVQSNLPKWSPVLSSHL